MHKVELDGFDVAIIDALRRNGSATNAELAEAVGLSASQCSRRRTKLESDGVIQGYQAKVSPQALGRELKAITRINLTSHSGENAKEFARFVTTNKEIEAAYSVSGDADYVLVIGTRDLASFAAFVHERLLPLPNVTQVRSDIVLQTLKDDQ